MFLIVLGAPGIAHAQGCYPPPCATSGPEASGTAAVPASPGSGPIGIGADRASSVAAADGPLWFVTAGLLLIGSTLGVIVVGRRSAMAREQRELGRVPAITPTRAPQREPSRSFT